MIKVYLSCFLILFHARYASSQVLESDSLALVDFYNSTNGDDWYSNTNWLNGPVSTWYGVTVTGNRVTSIILTGNLLSGTLNPSIGTLTALIRLDLVENEGISGEIPEEIGNLVQLTYLNLGLNRFSGSIPESLSNFS